MKLYDEAIEEATWHGEIEGPQTVRAILKALERAKKVEELVELYRKHINTLCKKDREGVKNSLFRSEFIAYELYEKIKQLEEELK